MLPSRNGRTPGHARPRPGRRPRRLGLSAGLVLGLTLSAWGLSGRVPAARDLDVGVPPGSPLDWSRAFPAITPARGDAFPRTPDSGDREGAADSDRTVSAGPEPTGFDVQSQSSFGVVRILTWDLAAHLSWVSDRPPPPGEPTTGRSGLHPPLPQPGEALYWMSLAPLLRVMLHPDAVSRSAVLAHLVEIGEPTLAVLPSAATEKALAELVLEVETYIRAPRDESPRPLTPEDPIAAMRSRLVFQELSTRFAYDPVAGFGERMFLLGDELVAEVAAYADNGNAFVRRNAVAALRRYRTPEAVRALLEVAVETDDAVALVRALGGLGRQGGRLDTGRLVERLESTDDPLMLVALIQAVGRAGVEASLPRLLALAEQALEADRRDFDVMAAVLTALADMRPRAERPAILKLVRKVAEDAGGKARAWAPRKGQPVLTPDNADPVDLRGRIIQQLAWIVQARLDPEDLRVRKALLALLAPAEAGSRNRSVYPVRSNDSLSLVHPPVRFLYLGTLAELGEPGVEALTQVARDRRAEPAIRGFALRQLPWIERTELGEALLADPDLDDELRIQVFEACVDARHPKLREMGLALIAEASAREPGTATPVQRYLALTAVRALSARRDLKAADLYPLLAHLKTVRSAHGDLPEQVQALVTQMVRRAAERAESVEIDRRVDELLDLVIAREVNPELHDRTRTGAKRDILELLSSARANRVNTEYLRLLGVEIAERVLGYALDRENRPQGEFVPRVLFEEEVLLALGRTRDPMAMELLINVLSNPQNRHRAAACLALGMLGRRGPERTLLRFLVDQDPFVRFCAATSLAHLVGREAAVDWYGATSAERLAGAEQYRTWIDAR